MMTRVSCLTLLITDKHFSCFISKLNKKKTFSVKVPDGDVIKATKVTHGNFWKIKGALWSFFVNKQKLCLRSVLLTKTHFVFLVHNLHRIM